MNVRPDGPRIWFRLVALLALLAAAHPMREEAAGPVTRLFSSPEH